MSTRIDVYCTDKGPDWVAVHLVTYPYTSMKLEGIPDTSRVRTGTIYTLAISGNRTDDEQETQAP